jgi:hypothetical protein
VLPPLGELTPAPVSLPEEPPANIGPIFSDVWQEHIIPFIPAKALGVLEMSSRTSFALVRGWRQSSYIARLSSRAHAQWCSGASKRAEFNLSSVCNFGIVCQALALLSPSKVTEIIINGNREIMNLERQLDQASDVEDSDSEDDENPFPPAPQELERLQKDRKNRYMKKVWTRSVEAPAALMEQLRRFTKLNRLVLDGVAFSKASLTQLGEFIQELGSLKQFEVHHFVPRSKFSAFASTDAVESEDLHSLATRLPINLRVLHWNFTGALTDDILVGIFSHPQLEELHLRGNRAPRELFDVSRSWEPHPDPDAFIEHQLQILDLIRMQVTTVRGLDTLPCLNSLLLGQPDAVSGALDLDLPADVALFRC